MKILFVMEKYIFYDKPEFGFTNNMHNLIGSWICSELGEYDVAYISPEDIWDSSGVDKILLEKEYDFAVISPYQGPNGCINCSYEIAEKLGKKLLFFWWDCVAFPLKGTFYHPETRTPGWCWWEYAERGCINYIMDHGKGEIYKNSYGVAVPQDTRIFCPENLKEDIDISFVGAYQTRGDRLNVINKIKNHFKIWVGGGRGHKSQHDNFTPQQYAEIHKRSKICLNLQYGHGRPQRKGRTFELAACGKFMMSNYPEMFNGVDGIFFKDGIDYISFNDHDLVNKLSYYLNNEDERKRMASNIYKKYQEQYSPSIFWKEAAERCK